MLKKNILATNMIFVSISHSDRILDKYFKELKKVFKRMKSFKINCNIKENLIMRRLGIALKGTTKCLKIKFFYNRRNRLFGQYLTKFLLKNSQVKKIIIFSRDELKQFKMKNDPDLIKHKSKLRFFIGDIRDKERLKYAFNSKIDYEFMQQP